jgi:membrane associated rhomboid family serine protease
MSGGASEEAPPLPALRQALLVAPVRLALGLAGLAAAVSIDLAFWTAIAEAALGASLTIFALVAPGGRRRPEQLRPPAWAPLPQPWWRALAVAMFPSTYGVALLTGISLAFNRDLAAFLSGVLLGMGAVALVYALSVRPEVHT